MTARPVVVVDPYSSGARLPALLRRAGLTPVGVTSYPVPPPAYTTAFRPEDFELLLAAGADPAPLIAELAELRPVAVVAGAESGVLLADRLAAELTPQLANDPALALARRHKGAMADALTRAGVPAIRSTFVREPEQAWAWVREQGLAGRDLVVKPSLSGGTEDVTLVTADQDGSRLREVVGRLLRRINVLGLPNDEVVVQERVTGTEYVVDTFSHGGRHTVTDICRYGKVANAGSFAVYESVEFLPYDRPGHAELVRYVERVLDALGVRFGLAHTEVMLTADGPRLIETGVRPPGAGLPALTELATGESGLHRLTRWLADGADPRADYALTWPVGAVYAIAPRGGVITNLAAYRRALDLPSCRHLQINVQDGDHVPATTDLLSTLRLGWAVLAHDDPGQLHRDRLAFRELEREVLITDPTPTPPPARPSR